MRLATIGNAVPISLAIIPETDLIEVMEPQCSCDGIDQGSLGNSLGDDMAEVELQKVDASHDGLMGICVTDLDENEEDEGDEEEERGEEGKGKASAGRCPYGR